MVPPALQRSYGEQNFARVRASLEETDSLSMLVDSAYLLERQGRLTEAEALYKQALSLGRQQLGSASPTVAETLTDLATLYISQNRYGEAELLLNQSLQIRTQYLLSSRLNPGKSLDLAENCYQLASVYRYQYQCDKAEPLFQRSLSIFQQKLGPTHPRTQAIRNDLMHMLAPEINQPGTAHRDSHEESGCGNEVT